MISSEIDKLEKLVLILLPKEKKDDFLNFMSVNRYQKNLNDILWFVKEYSKLEKSE